MPNLCGLWRFANAYLYKNIKEEDYQDTITNINEGLEVISWRKEKGNVFVDVVNYTEQEKSLEVPLIYYYGYEAEGIDTNEKIFIDIGQSHRIKLIIPANYEGEICIKFQEPFVWRISEVVSICTSIWFAICIVRNRKNKQYE